MKYRIDTLLYMYKHMNIYTIATTTNYTYIYYRYYDITTSHHSTYIDQLVVANNSLCQLAVLSPYVPVFA